MTDICVTCGAKCCQYFCFQIDTPETVEQYEDIRWFLLHEGVSVHIDEGDWYMSVMKPCYRLQDGRCTIYEDRPLICRKYSTDNCDYTAGDYGYEKEFRTPEEIEAYAREQFEPGDFDRRRDAHRAKLAAKHGPRPKAKPKRKAKSADAPSPSAGRSRKAKAKDAPQPKAAPQRKAKG